MNKNEQRIDSKKYIREKLQEWIGYEENRPKVPYEGNEEEHDMYRLMHDRDCVLAHSNLNADTIISLWSPLKLALSKLHQDSAEVTQLVNSGKISCCKKLMEGDTLDRLLPEEAELTGLLEELFELGLGAENVMLLPERWMNSKRGMAPYYDYMPAFLYECFADGAFSRVWKSEKELKDWIETECLQPMFYDNVISRENIRDLNGTGNLKLARGTQVVQNAELLIQNYIEFLKERKKLINARGITFGTFRKLISPTVRVSVCTQETGIYEDYESILEVPDTYDEVYLFGFGMRDSLEFNLLDSQKELVWLSAMEIVISEQPRYHLNLTEEGRDGRFTLGQFTRNYTQTTKRGLLTTNKG